MILHKTEAGQAAFKTRSPALSARQRSAFLLFDGQRSLSDVLGATAGLGIGPSDIEDLVEKGFLATGLGAFTPLPPEAQDTVPAARDTPPDLEGETPALRYQRAYPVATRITARLGLRGFRLNLAVEAASGYDDLVALLPQISAAVGEEAASELRRALGC